MLFHYALRSIISHPLLNGIKVLGLALGLTGILFITLFIRYELSYDTFHSKVEKIYRITTTSPQFLTSSHFARIPNSEHVPDLAEYFTGIENFVRLVPPGGEANDMFPFELEGRQRTDQQEDDRIGVFPCDYSFAEVFNLDFIGGRNFTEHNADADGSGEYIINESAMHYFNYSDPGEIIGKGFKLISNASGVDLPAGRIIGVVKDFHLSSMKEKVRTLVLFKREDIWLINFVISHNYGMREAAYADIRKVWEEMFGEYPLEFEHVGSMYRKVYRSELLQSSLLAPRFISYSQR